MKIQIKNLGPLKQAEFSLGDLTIICGGNNTGKTYATYTLFGFLHDWHKLLSIDIQDDKIWQLLNDGVMIMDLQEYTEKAGQILAEGCQKYTKQLSKVFAAPADRFQKTAFQVILDTQHIRITDKFERKMSTENAEIFSITKKEESTELTVTLLAEKEKVKIPSDVIRAVIADTVKEIIFGHLFPNPFISSAERTGTAIFQKELNFARNRLLDEVSRADKMINPMELLLKDYQNYALPVEMNVEFIRQLESIEKKRSFIAERHPEMLSDFADIIAGDYTVTRNDQLYFVPKGKEIKLSMGESSSAVRSLLDIGFYLRHAAQPGDLLMVDEPELNLHPENQRRMARVFARLVNLDIRVFITTHSDYIIKELNTLIMLNHDKPHLKRIAETEGYRPEELISSDKIRVYIAETALVKSDDNDKETLSQTLTLADTDPELGIEARSFDTTIETMNRIQKEIVWGGE